MTYLNKPALLDNILLAVHNTDAKAIKVSDIAIVLQLDFYVAYTLVKDLLRVNYLEQIAPANTYKESKELDFEVKLSPEGQFFLLHEKSFLQERQSEIRKIQFGKFKTAALYINSIIIICVSAWALLIASNVNKLNNDLNSKNVKIKQLTNEIELMKEDLKKQDKSYAERWHMD